MNANQGPSILIMVLKHDLMNLAWVLSHLDTVLVLDLEDDPSLIVVEEVQKEFSLLTRIIDDDVNFLAKSKR